MPEALSWVKVLNQQTKRVEHTLSRGDYTLEDIYVDMGNVIEVHLLFLRYREELLKEPSISLVREILQQAENGITEVRNAAREAYYAKYEQAVREAEHGSGNVVWLREQRHQLEEREQVLDAQDVG